jgi:anaerobic selenocysteine-containing dehydrogenase
MSPTRRDFLWTMGTAAGAMALLGAEDRFWAWRYGTDVGWVPGVEGYLASTCMVCPSHCGITGRVVDEKLVRILGNKLHPLSKGGLCPRGIAGVQTLYHPERISSPMVRVGERGSGEWQEISHEDALGRISDRLQSMRGAGHPETLAVLAGYCPGTMQDVWSQFMTAFGSPNFIQDAYEDGTDSVMATMHGISRRPSYDLENAEIAMSFGAPIFEAWWAPVQAFTAFAKAEQNTSRRRRFIQVDQRFSRTAGNTDEWVGVHAGTHGVLALGMAYVIVRDRLYDEAFLAERVAGFEDFTGPDGRTHEGFRSLVLRRYRSEEVSAITGVSVERITELARAFAGTDRSVAVCGADVTQAPDGLLAAMAVHSLNLLVGAINRSGGVMFGDDPPLAPLAPVSSDQTSLAGLTRQPVGGPGPTVGDGNRAARFVQAIASSDESPVAALLVHGTNPVGASSEPDAWAQALMKVPFVVSFSPFLDETAQLADIILPDLLPYERWQDAPGPTSYPYPIWGLARPLVEPSTAGMHTGEAVFALARSLGGGVSESLPYENFEPLLKERARGLYDAGHGRTFASEFELEIHRQREARGWWLAPQSDPESFWSDLVQNGGWVDLFHDDMDPDRFAQTSSGRIEMMPAELIRTLEGDGRELYVLNAPEAAADQPLLRLLPYRVSTLASDTIGLQAWLAEQPGTHPDVQWVPWVTVAPATAQAQGLEDETMVWVSSDRGRYRALLKFSVGTAPDTVCAPYGLRHPGGEAANPLALLDGSSDPLTGVPSWNTTFVRLERA